MPKGTCTIDGCDRPHQARGFCATHYMAARRDGMKILDKTGQHWLTDVDRENAVATCSTCGPNTRIVALNQPRPGCGNQRREARAIRWELNRVKLREYQREYGRRWRFRLPPGGIEQLLEEQGGLCAICDQALTVKTAVIDHDHACCPAKASRTCGACVRGMLCNSCNSGLGHFKDSPDQMLRAIDYLGRRTA